MKHQPVDPVAHARFSAKIKAIPLKAISRKRFQSGFKVLVQHQYPGYLQERRSCTWHGIND